jgi:hypothetical protein
LKWDQNPDIEKETVFPACHCEHLKGTCLHAEVTAFTDSLCYLGVTARRRGNLIEKDGIASFLEYLGPLHWGRQFRKIILIVL